MNKQIYSTLKVKISFFIIILLLVTASLFIFLILRSTDRHILSQFIRRAEALSKSIAAIAPYSILSGDVLGTDNIGWKVKEANSDIEYIALTSKDLKILAHTDAGRTGQTLLRPGSSPVLETVDGTRVYEVIETRGFEVHSPIKFNDRHIGNVIIGLNQSVLTEARSETRRMVALGLGVTMLLGVGCIIILSSLITKPINELSRGVDELMMGRRTKLQVYSDDELGKLTSSFNHMTELTTLQQTTLRMYAQEVEDSFVSTIKVLTAAIDARDPYTLGHSTRVAKLAVKMGEAIGLPRRELEDLEIASLFHDVGKLRTPDSVLLKEGPLNPEEHREIASHCENGAAILSRAGTLQKYIPAIRHHHEWFNGEGYPDGLRGEDIPLHASIIAIADAFDAMTSVRPYKKSFSREDALVELTAFSGRQFNPWLVQIFQSMFDSDPVLAEQCGNNHAKIETRLQRH